MCEAALYINIELTYSRNDGDCRVGPYPQKTVYAEKYNIGLINNLFVNDTTNVTSYCLENCDEVNNLKSCDTIRIKKGKHYAIYNTGKICIIPEKNPNQSYYSSHYKSSKLF